MRVDLVDVLAEFRALLGLNLLNLLETTGLHELTLGIDGGRENLGKLRAHIREDVVGRKLQEWLEGLEVGAHLDDVLECLLGLVFEVLAALRKHVDGKEAGRHVGLSQCFRVIGGVATDLAERPGGSGLQVILWLVEQRLLQWRDALGNDNGHGQRVVEGRNITECHDSGKPGVTLRLTDVVDGGGGTT